VRCGAGVLLQAASTARSAQQPGSPARSKARWTALQVLRARRAIAHRNHLRAHAARAATLHAMAQGHLAVTPRRSKGHSSGTHTKAMRSRNFTSGPVAGHGTSDSSVARSTAGTWKGMQQLTAAFWAERVIAVPAIGG
jgi:hypothetical protein